MDSMLRFVMGITLRLLHICYQVSMKLRKVEARCGTEVKQQQWTRLFMVGYISDLQGFHAGDKKRKL